MTERVIGVDFGSAGIKLAEVRSNKGKYVVEHQAFLPLDPEAITGGYINPDYTETIASELKALVVAEKFKTKFAVLGTNSVNEVFANRAITKFHDPKDFQEAIRNEAMVNKGLLKGAPSASLIESVIFRDFEDTDGERKLDALLLAVTQSAVEIRAEILKKAGLIVVGSDISALASLRAVRQPIRDAGNVDVIVDLGHEVLSVVIHENGTPYAISILPSLGASAADDIISEYVQNDDQAFIDRSKTGLKVDPRVQDAINDYSLKVTNAVYAAVRSYVEEYPQGRVIGITLLGGGVLLSGLGEAFEQRFGVPIALGEFRQDIEGAPARYHEVEPSGSYSLHYDNTVAVGLGMGATV